MDPLGELLNGTSRESSNISGISSDYIIGSDFFTFILFFYAICVLGYMLNWLIKIFSIRSYSFDERRERIVDNIETLYECNICCEEWDSEEEAVDCCSENSYDEIYEDKDCEDDEDESEEIVTKEDNKNKKDHVFNDGEDRIVW